jgi:phosphoribosylpyrophosphate synthetase
MDDKNWVVVYTSRSPIEAEIVKQMLESNGVEAVLLNQHDSSYQTFGSAQVYVPKESEPVAIKLIEEVEL